VDGAGPEVTRPYPQNSGARRGPSTLSTSRSLNAGILKPEIVRWPFSRTSPSERQHIDNLGICKLAQGLWKNPSSLRRLLCGYF
jgi:hypothetical protein